MEVLPSLALSKVLALKPYVPAPAIEAELTAEVDDASQAIARFDARAGHDLSNYSSLLLRSESAASSQIEQLTASARNIALAELRPTAKENASLIVANTRAVQAAIALADDLSPQAILATHKALLEASQPEIVGKWRDQQVWIGGKAYGPHEALFVPPHHQHVPAAMEDFVKFVARDDMPALTHAAIAHAHFETIHPFPDGNGRTGRALVHAMLQAKGLTRSVTVPMSGGLLTNLDDYFAALTAYREGEVSPIVEAFASAAFHAIDNGTKLVEGLQTVRQQWHKRIVARSHSTVWPMIDLLLHYPIVTTRLVVDELGVSKPSALGAIDTLVEAEVLREGSGRSRGREWEAPEVLAALDGFASRAGRRQQPA